MDKLLNSDRYIEELLELYKIDNKFGKGTIGKDLDKLCIKWLNLDNNH